MAVPGTLGPVLVIFVRNLNISFVFAWLAEINPAVSAGIAAGSGTAATPALGCRKSGHVVRSMKPKPLQPFTIASRVKLRIQMRNCVSIAVYIHHFVSGMLEMTTVSGALVTGSAVWNRSLIYVSGNVAELLTARLISRVKCFMFDLTLTTLFPTLFMRRRRKIALYRSNKFFFTLTFIIIPFLNSTKKNKDLGWAMKHFTVLVRNGIFLKAKPIYLAYLTLHDMINPAKPAYAKDARPTWCDCLMLE